MAAEAPLNFRVQVLEREDVPRLQGNVNVTTSANDTLKWNLDITEHDFLGDSWRTLGIAIDIDRGEGVLSPLTDAEMPTSVSLTGSVEGFGVRELAFGKLGNGQSPLRTAALRGPHRVRMSGIRGTLGGFREWPMFDGYFRDTGVTLFPPAASITAQDGSVLARMLTYTLAARSGQTRRAIVTDICQRHGVKIGTFTFTDAGNLGGYVYKEINEAGTRSVLEFLGEFLLPTGCRPYWRNGALSIKRFAITDTSKRTLTFSDIRSLNVTPPAANVPNVVRVASDIYPYVGPQLDGVQAPVTSGVVNAVYQPLVATHKQDHTTGVISALALSSTATMREVAKTVTTDTYVAGTLSSRVIERWAWYAPKAANRKQNADGTTRYNEDFTVYKFADLTWRTQQEETYQVVERREITRTFHPSTRILWNEVERYRTFWDRWTPIGQRNAGNTATIYTANVYMTDDGVGWTYGKERIDSGATFLGMTQQRWYEWDAATRRLVHLTHNVTAERVFLAVAGPAASTWVYGPTSAPLYSSIGGFSADGNVMQAAVWRTTFAELTPTSYRSTLVRTYQQQQLIQWAQIPSPLSATTVDVNEPLPVIEMEVAYAVHRPAATTRTDAVRRALSHYVALSENFEAGWCETIAEQEMVAAERLREIGALMVDVEMDLDWNLNEGDVITVPPHDDLGPVDRALLIRTATWNVDAANPGNSSLQLSCWALPPELV